MVVGNVPEGVDFLVAGAGPGGYTAALKAAQAGRQVTLVDPMGNDGMGGVCLRTGCIPSKALIEVAEVSYRSRTGFMGFSAVNGLFDAAVFQQSKRCVIDKLAGGVRDLLRRAGVEVLNGTLSLTDAETAIINMTDGSVRFLSFRSLVLATGSSPTELDTLPFDRTQVLDSTGVLEFAELPATLAVVGAGYIGVELGTALAKLGVRVSLLDVADGVLPSMDSALSKVVERRLRDLGVTLMLSTQASGFASGALNYVQDDGTTGAVEAEKVLVAVGRHPNSAGLGIEGLGIQLAANGLIPVERDQLLTPRIAAIGDLTAGPALAHKATAEADVAVAALCGKKAAFDALIPEVVFSDPEIAVVGLTEVAAQSNGLDVSTARYPLTASGRAATLGKTEGFVQLIFESTENTLLGVQIAGPHASDLISEAVLAIEMGASIEDLALTIHPHPTFSESLSEAAHLALSKSRTPKV